MGIPDHLTCLLRNLYIGQNWIIKKDEHRGIDTFELWCWRRLMRVPWTARRPKGDQSWVFVGRTDAEAETPILWPPDMKSWLIWKDSDAWKVESRRKRGRQRMRWLDGITDSMDVGLGELRSWWWTGRPVLPVLQFMGWQRVSHSWVSELNWNPNMLLMSLLLSLGPVSLQSVQLQGLWVTGWSLRGVFLWSELWTVCWKPVFLFHYSSWHGQRSRPARTVNTWEVICIKTLCDFVTEGHIDSSNFLGSRASLTALFPLISLFLAQSIKYYMGIKQVVLAHLLPGRQSAWSLVEQLSPGACGFDNQDSGYDLFQIL